jgi:hypothetical protein
VIDSEVFQVHGVRRGTSAEGHSQGETQYRGARFVPSVVRDLHLQVRRLAQSGPSTTVPPMIPLYRARELAAYGIVIQSHLSSKGTAPWSSQPSPT